MTEATRLTREGRLDEAMALLQGGPRPAPSTPPEPPKPSGPAAAQAARPARPVLDLVPPSPASGGAWTAPPGDGAAVADAPRPEGPAQASPGGVPHALRGLSQRLGGLASGPDLAALGGGLNGGLTGGFGGGLSGGLSAGLAGLSGLASGRGAGSGASAPALPEGARFEERVHTGPHGSRPYKLYVPSTHQGEALPLVVMLHGCTQSPDDFAAGTRMNELAEELGFLVAYPAQTQAANAQRCWNWFNAADQTRDKGEPALIAGIVREVMQDHPVQEGRVFAAGLSAGGAKAAILAATHPDLFAAVGVHSGLACGAARDMPSAFTAMKQGGAATGGLRGGPLARPVPTIVFHGDRDTTVHPVNGDEVAAQAGTAGRRPEVTTGQAPGGRGFTRKVHRDASGQAVLEQWVLHGAGHAWSGGSASGSYTDPSGPDASREMMRFFLAEAAPAQA
jgi:poly(hydroxyalkanoate) depolymerase family esterase